MAGARRRNVFERGTFHDDTALKSAARHDRRGGGPTGGPGGRGLREQQLEFELQLLAAAGGAAGSSTTLVGAGSTLVAPLMSQWQPAYDTATGVAVTYGAIGSGGGIAQITARTVDFGASDAPLTPSQFSDAKGVVQIPWALAATVVAYNVKGVPNQLKLSGPLLADIWMGKVTTWNDPASRN